MFSKKKKKGLHFDFISDFPIFLPKSRCSLKKKKVFTPNRPLSKHLQRIQNCICCFRGGALKIEGGLRRLPHSPHPISTTARRKTSKALNSHQLSTNYSDLLSQMPKYSWPVKIFYLAHYLLKLIWLKFRTAYRDQVYNLFVGSVVEWLMRRAYD